MIRYIPPYIPPVRPHHSSGSAEELPVWAVFLVLWAGICVIAFAASWIYGIGASPDDAKLSRNIRSFGRSVFGVGGFTLILLLIYEAAR